MLSPALQFSQCVLKRRAFLTKRALEQELAKYIEYYNHKRIKAKLKGMSPVQYRAHAQRA
ncbi:IS3 family transposase [Peribacillus butanolivorans]|uniref:IS3 family transposase n=1 Tax=Peribacillus butanolivorans TaxID=421767 RepID=UPI0037C8FA54